MSYYPPIEIQTIRNIGILKKLLKENPDYLNSVECPYPMEVMTFFRTENTTSSQGKAVGGKEEKQYDDKDTNIDVQAEILTTFKDLNRHKPDPNDAAAVQGYYRTRTALLTKLSELLDKSKNQKQIGDFYQAVLTILDDICTPSQREQFRELLTEFAK